MKYTPKTKQWFIERIGKTIHRDKKLNCCKTCDHVETNGLKIHDEQHAEYLAMIDADFANEGVFMNYQQLKKKK